MAVFNGTDGNDSIVGTAGSDSLYGFGGDDFLSGAGGTDTLDGGAGNDSLYGGKGSWVSYVSAPDAVAVDLVAGTATGGAGDDELHGLDNVYGSEFADSIVGNSSGNWLIANGGDDTIRGGGGSDSINGGNGVDTLVFSGNLSEYAVDLDNGSVTINDTIADRDGTDHGSLVEFLQFADQTLSVNSFLGLDIVGTADADTLIGGARGDTLSGEGGNDYVSGAAGADNLAGGDGDDTIEGGAGNDFLDAGGGDNRLLGGDGMDFISVGSGNDYVSGGPGEDYVDYFYGVSGAIQVDLTAGTATGGAGNDTLVGIEDVNGSSFDDDEKGDGQFNILNGQRGNDTLEGLGGDDWLYGGKGNDLMTGGLGNDFVTGDEGTGDVAVFSGPRADYGVSSDSPYSDGVRVTDHVPDRDGSDDVRAVEFFQFSDGTISLDELIAGGLSSAGGEFLQGTDGPDTLTGLDGNDSLYGGKGDDVLTGGGSYDVLSGGDGSDTAVFSGPRAEYSVSSDSIWSDGIRLTDQLPERDGVDDVRFVEYFQFTDGTITLEELLDDGSSSGGPSGGSSGGPSSGGVLLQGTDASETLTGGAGDDSLYGGKGNDVLTGGGGDDVIAGDGGGDTAVFSGPRSNYSVSHDSAFSGGIRLTDQVSGRDGADDVRNVEYFQFSDGTISIGDLEPPAFVQGTSAAESLIGGLGNDTLEGLAGDDTLNGDGGIDTVSYENAPGSVFVNLPQGVASGADGNDVLISIERAVGSAFGDRIDVGGGGIAFGGPGNDVLSAADSSATLVGGPGDDRLYGGKGSDIAVFEGNLDNYTFAATDAGFSLLVFSGDGSVDRLAEDIDILRFDDGDSSATDLRTQFSDVALHLVGTDGDDELTGSINNDTLYGGEGNDTLAGGSGDDTLDGGAGVDTVRYEYAAGPVSVDLSLGIATGAWGSDSLSSIESVGGTSTADVLKGAAGDEVLDGGEGDDTLEGGAGADTLYGGKGSDTAVFEGNRADYEIAAVNATTFTVHDTTSSRDGTDRVYDAEFFQFADGVRAVGELLSVDGTASNDVVTGTNQADFVHGFAGNDNLVGGLGNDTLDGGLGNDTLNGGDGFDVASYASVSAAIRVSLAIVRGQNTGGAGSDTLVSIEGVVGGSGNDSLTGSSAANRLEGGLGNDTLDGGAGADTLIGGVGNDSYFVDNAADVVTELSGQGADKVTSSVSFTLDGNIESLVLTGRSSIDGTGNSLDNAITGNSQANSLWGADGSDTLDGGAGADTLYGGKGDDTFVVDNLGDVVFEEAGGWGNDTIVSSVNRALPANVENLVLATGSHAATGTGNDLDNHITGNAGANTLNGAAGNDILDGKAGADVLTGGAGMDTFIFSTALAKKSIDRISDFHAADDTIWLDHAIFGTLPEGGLGSAAFQSGASSAALSASVRIIFNTATGALSYDADGSGSSRPVQFATIELAGLAGPITADDFVTI